MLEKTAESLQSLVPKRHSCIIHTWCILQLVRLSITPSTIVGLLLMSSVAMTIPMQDEFATDIAEHVQLSADARRRIVNSDRAREEKK